MMSSIQQFYQDCLVKFALMGRLPQQIQNHRVIVSAYDVAADTPHNKPPFNTGSQVLSVSSPTDNATTVIDTSIVATIIIATFVVVLA